MSRSSDSGAPGRPPQRPAIALPSGRGPGPAQLAGPAGSPYAEQEAFDGPYDSYGDPLTGPPTRDPRLPDNRLPDHRLHDYRVPAAAPGYASPYPGSFSGQTGAATAYTPDGYEQPVAYDQHDQNGYQADPRYQPDPRQDPRQRHEAYGWQPELQQLRPDTPAAPGPLRAKLPPSQPISLQPTAVAPRGPTPVAPPHHAPAAGPVSAPPALAGQHNPGQQANEADAEPDTLRPPPSNAPSGQREMYAPARTDRTDKAQGTAPIVPAGSVTGRSLTLVISIMCFLASLTAGAVYMMNQSASAWLKDIASEVTVQVEGRDKTDGEKIVTEVAAFLSKQPGIVRARVLTLAESGGLLEPWLGNTEALKTLAVPRLIALELDRRTPPEFEPLRAKLSAAFKGVFLDDHRQWQTQILTVTRSFALGGLAILLLVGAATTAIIISATRAAMASNRDIVEVLHFVGATDRFIAREFERNFLRLGVRAGLVGTISAMLVFAAMPSLMELLGGGTVSLAEMRRLVGSGTLDMIGYLLLAGLVVVVAAMCMLTSRFSVYRILHARQ
jgi:cell division transport system permease protein